MIEIADPKSLWDYVANIFDTDTNNVMDFDNEEYYVMT